MAERVLVGASSASLRYQWVRVRGPSHLCGGEPCGVVLQRATDKLIHVLTLLTRPSDFVKLTIDQASALSTVLPLWQTHTHTQLICPQLLHLPCYFIPFLPQLLLSSGLPICRRHKRHLMKLLASNSLADIIKVLSAYFVDRYEDGMCVWGHKSSFLFFKSIDWKPRERADFCSKFMADC